MPAVSSLFLARCSEIAYPDDTVPYDDVYVSNRLKPYGWELERIIAIHDTECFVASSGDDVVIAFRGTEPTHIRDLMTDARASKTLFFGGMVHSGFLSALDNVWDALCVVRDDIQRKRPEMRLHVTGHSLGAALALLAGLRFRFSTTPARLTTFGCPRVGDASFANLVDRSLSYHVRYVNNNDIVARLPLPTKWIQNYIPFGWLLPAGFKHCGELRYITTNGDTIVNPSALRLCKDRALGRWYAASHFLTDGSRDHPIHNYVRLVT